MYLEEFSEEQREMINTRFAVALIRELHKEGKISDKAMAKIEKLGQERIEKFRKKHLDKSEER